MEAFAPSTLRRRTLGERRCDCGGIAARQHTGVNCHRPELLKGGPVSTVAGVAVFLSNIPEGLSAPSACGTRVVRRRMSLSYGERLPSQVVSPHSSVMCSCEDSRSDWLPQRIRSDETLGLPSRFTARGDSSVPAYQRVNGAAVNPCTTIEPKMSSEAMLQID